MANTWEEHFDVAVIGGGPGGASAAILLASAGKRVVLFERSRFPRFHIGESLLPACWELWRRLGVSEKIEAEGFAVKQGINFGVFNEKPELVLLTAEYPEYFERPYTFHVERARFDEILLDRALQCGAVVRQEWSVHNVLFEESRAVGVLAGPNGAAPHPVKASVVIDGSGRDCLVSRKLGWRHLHPALNKVSHYAHFAGAWRRDPGTFVTFGPVLENSVATDIHTIEGGWVWYIPLRNDVTSVGVVLDPRFSKRLGASPQESFDRALESCECVRQWLKPSRQIQEVQTVSSIAYLTDRFYGDGFLLVGDAAVFIDPIFSAGVTLAMRSGVYAAETILKVFRQGNDFSAARLRGYEARIREPMNRIFPMIYNWYRILEEKDANNILLRARRSPMLRERFIVLLSGGYDRVSMDEILKAAEEPHSTYLSG